MDSNNKGDETCEEEEEFGEEDGSSSTEEYDLKDDCEAELDEITETLDPHRDIEVAVGIEAVIEHYRTANRKRRMAPIKNPEKVLEQHDDGEENNFHDGKETFLDDSDVESLNEEIIEDGIVELRRTQVRFPRYDENYRTVTFSIGQSFTDHKQFKRALLKYVVQEKRDYIFLKKMLFTVLEIDNIESGAKQSLENKDINQWCRAFFKSGTKCDCVDNNSTEAWNFILISARSKPIVSMNESIREYLMERRIQRINFVSKWKLNCGPNIIDTVNENCIAGCRWKIKWNGAEEFQVYYGRTQHCVHIGDKTCSCGAWQLSGIPCCHATTAIKSRAKDPFDYLDKCYSKEKFIAAYNHPIKVVGSEEFLPNSGRGELYPLLPKPMPGSPKKARRRRKYEPKKSKTKISRHGKDMHCGICNSNTHNSKTCSLYDGASTSHDASAPRNGTGNKRKKRVKTTV